MKITKLIILMFFISSTMFAQTVEKLGVPIKSSNLLSELHPSNDPASNRVLPFIAKKSNGDLVSVMIDLKKVSDNGIAEERFSLVSVNMKTASFKKLEFLPQAGNSSPQTFGNPWVKFEGPNKKIYFSTVEAGGNLLQYDIDGETATDLGSPFVIGNQTFGIYSMAIGSDSAIYGGSYSNSIGNTFAFRYDPKTNEFWKYMQPIDKDLQYVSYVGGDAVNTYVICGQSTWNVYSINRTTNVVTKLLTSATRIYGIDNTSCGCFITVDDNKRYKLSGSAATLTTQPPTCQYVTFTYSYVEPVFPKAYWNEVFDTYYYQVSNEPVTSLVLNLTKQERKIQALVNFKDSIIVGNGSTYSYTISYNPTNGEPAKLVGDNRSTSVHSMLSHNNKVFIGGYPSGSLEMWDPARPWTYGTRTLTYTPPPIRSPESNPSLVASYRPASQGIHELYIVGATNNGHVIVTGNNIRTDTSLSVGLYRDGATQQLINPERFADLFVVGSTMSHSKQTAFVLGTKKNASENWVFEYDPLKNDMIDSFPIFKTPIRAMRGLIMLPNEELFGEVLDNSGDRYLYTFDIHSKEITWKQKFASSTNIFFKLGTDEQVWFTTTPITTRTTVLRKFNPYTREVGTGPTVQNPDIGINSNITDIAFFKNDIYLAGFLNLLRVKNVVEPVPPNLTAEEKIMYLFNTYKKVDTSCN